MVSHLAGGPPVMGAPHLGSTGPVRTPTTKEINAAYLAFVKRAGDIGVPQQKLLDAMLDAIVAAERVREGCE